MTTKVYNPITKQYIHIKQSISGDKKMIANHDYKKRITKASQNDLGKVIRGLSVR